MPSFQLDKRLQFSTMDAGVFIHDKLSLSSAAKRPNLELERRPKQLVGYLNVSRDTGLSLIIFLVPHIFIRGK
jgi:hypothetical protein